MRSMKHVEKLVKNAAIHSKPDVNQVVLRDLLKEFPEKKAQKPALSQTNIGRIIMKTRIAKLAAAAVIIMAAVSGIHLFTGSGASVALGEVKAAMQKIDWVHTTAEGTRLEGWFAFESKIIVEQQEDGTITYIDFGQNRQFYYDRRAEMLKVSKIVPDEVFGPGFEGPFFERYDNAFEFLADTAKLIRAEGGKFKQSHGEYKGTNVLIWELSHKAPGYGSLDAEGNIAEAPREEYGHEMIKVFIDAEKHLPLAINSKFVKDGKLVHETHTNLEYPDAGPKDIYDLGVPEATKIVNETQQPQNKAK